MITKSRDFLTCCSKIPYFAKNLYQVGVSMHLKVVWSIIGVILLLIVTTVPLAPSPPTNPSPFQVKDAIPPLSQLTLSPAGDLPVISTPESGENHGPAISCFIGIMTKLGYFGRPLLLNKDVTHMEDVLVESAAGPAPRAAAAPAVVIPQNHPQDKRFMSPWQPNVGNPGSISCGYSFPVAAPFTFRDSWGDFRSGGRLHRAVDIFAAEGTPVYAVTAGTVKALANLPGAGIMLLMEGRDGRGYGYMHLWGYAAGIVEGKAVKTGEIIGYVGRTGTQNSPAHLHFQVYADHRLAKDELLNPYAFLVQLCRGVGVSDLNQPKGARIPEPERKINQIVFYQAPTPSIFRKGSGPQKGKDSFILVIKNY